MSELTPRERAEAARIEENTIRQPWWAWWRRYTEQLVRESRAREEKERRRHERHAHRRVVVPWSRWQDVERLAAKVLRKHGDLESAELWSAVLAMDSEVESAANEQAKAEEVEAA